MRQTFELRKLTTLKWYFVIVLAVACSFYLFQYSKDPTVTSNSVKDSNSDILQEYTVACEIAPTDLPNTSGVNEYQEGNDMLQRVEPTSDSGKEDGLRNGDLDFDGREVRNVVFVKVHKAASTTMTNIVHRFAVSRKLNIVVPKEGHLLNEAYFTINPDEILPAVPGQPYNVLCNHLIFNENEIRRFVPASTKFIGIVREPFAQFTSAFYFYALVYHEPRYVRAMQESPSHPISGFLSNPKLYDSIPANLSYTNNRMSIDFGFPPLGIEKNKHDTQVVSKFIEYLDRTFSFVVVVEMFDESLVLLRRMFNWKTKDILYLNINSGVKHSDWSARFLYRVTNERVRALHEAWSPIDHALYNHFYHKLKDLIKNQTIDFREELLSFQDIRNRVTNSCQILKNSPNSHKQAIRVEATRWSPTFCVTLEDCRQLQMNEMDITHIARIWQRKKLATAGHLNATGSV